MQFFEFVRGKYVLYWEKYMVILTIFYIYVLQVLNVHVNEVYKKLITIK